MTVNQSQVQTILGTFDIILLQHCLSHRMIYVATTGATYSDNVKYFIKRKYIGTRNLVITEII